MLIMFSFVSYLAITVIFVIFAMSMDGIFMKWLCLEITMVLFCPIMIMFSDSPNSLSGLKYFISQSPASALLLFSFFTNPFMNSLSMILMLSSLLFKLGVPPFQGWAVNLLKDLNSMSMYLLLSIQKFIPLSLFEITATKMGVLGGLIMLTYLFVLVSLNILSSFFFLILISSIGNTLWMLYTSMVANIWVEFMVVYCGFLMSIMLLGWTYNMNKMSPSTNLTLTQASLISVAFLNIGGLPPLSGFFLKLFMLKTMMNSVFIAFSLIMMSLMLMYIYISFCYYVFCFKFNQYIKKQSSNLGWILIMMMTFTINPLTFLLS